jgi:hypothetical protein
MKNDINTLEKIYRLLKIRVKLVLDKNKSKKSFEKIVENNRKKESIDIDNPKTFDDKLWYIKKHFYSDLAAKCADKVLVREYVKQCGLEDILVPIYGIYDKASDIDFKNLPDECYIKCNHTSGCNYLYRKGKTDEKWLRKLFSLYLKRNYYNVKREWVYKYITPKIIAEKVLECEGGLVDYRMFCFNGKLQMVLVKKGTATELGEHSKIAERSFYTREFEWLPDVTILNKDKAIKPVEKPYDFEKMVSIAEKLSAPFEFCRVDLYNIEGRIYLSELTFFPTGAVNIFKPQEFSLKLGSYIDLERCKNNPVYEFIE